MHEVLAMDLERDGASWRVDHPIAYAFGCRRLHSSRASRNCAGQGSFTTPTLGALSAQTCFPNLINSSSDIRRRRSRNFCNVTSSDSNAIDFRCDIAGLPAEVGIYSTPSVLRR